MTRQEFEAKVDAFRDRARRDCKPHWRYRWYTRQWHTVNQWPAKWGYVSSITGTFHAERMQRI